MGFHNIHFATGCLASSLLILVSCLAAAEGLASHIPLRFEKRGDPSSLRDWAKENGVSFADGVGFSQSEGVEDDWQIEALDAQQMHLEKGSVLLSVPKDLILSSVRIENEMEGGPLAGALQTLEQRDFADHKGEFLLFLKILKEVLIPTTVKSGEGRVKQVVYLDPMSSSKIFHGSLF